MSKSHPQKLSELSKRLISLSRFKKAITPAPINSLNDLLILSLSTSITVGSMEYKQIWKRKITPSGTLYWEHTARAPRTSGNGYGGWPTPTKGNADGSQKAKNASATGRRPDGSKATVSLNAVAQLAGWNTPRATDGKNGGPNQAGGALSHDASLSGWSTPTSRDHKDGQYQANVPVNALLGRQAWLSRAATDGPGALNPAHSRWLMGYPVAWDFCGATATLLCRKSRRRS